MITLQNREKRLQTYNLVCKRLEDAQPPYGYVQIQAAVVDEDPRTGARRPRVIKKMAPAALTFLAGETKNGLPDDLLLCEEIKTALASGVLRLLSQGPDPSNDIAEEKPVEVIALESKKTDPEPFVSVTEEPPPDPPKPARGPRKV